MYDPTLKGNGRTALGDASQASPTYATVPESGRYLTLSDALQLLRRRLWLIILVAFVFVGSAVGFSLWQTPVYEASGQLLVGQKPSKGEQPNLMSSVEGLQQLTHTVVAAVDSRPIAEAVIQELNLQLTPQDLLNNLSAEQIEDTHLIQLSYRDTDPERAQKILTYVSEVSSERISEAISGVDIVTVTVWEPATVLDAPVSPDPVRNGLLALGLGLMLGTGLALLLEIMNNRWRSAEEVEQASGVPNFGAIPEFDAAKAGTARANERWMIKPQRGADANYSSPESDRESFGTEAVTVQDPAGVASEAYRKLRTNLFYAMVDAPPKVIVVASANHREGKSTTIANLGIALAQAGKNTLILDCDLRKPTLHKTFGKHNVVGVVDILIGDQKMQDVWQELMPGLKLISAGSTPPNPAELLSSRRLAELLGQGRQDFDYVLIDTPPLEGASEAAALAANGDGVLLILDSQHTS